MPCIRSQSTDRALGTLTYGTRYVAKLPTHLQGGVPTTASCQACAECVRACELMWRLTVRDPQGGARDATTSEKR